MTTKEIAETAGVSTETVSRKIKELYPEEVKNGKSTRLPQSKALNVMSELRKMGFVTPLQNDKLPLQNDKLPLQNDKLPLQNDKFDRLERLETLMAAQIGMIEHLCKALAAIPAVMQRRALPDIVQDYFTIKGYSAKEGCRLTFSEAQSLGRMAKILSIRMGQEIRHVEDERFGIVNSYHVSVLDEVFHS